MWYLIIIVGFLGLFLWNYNKFSNRFKAQGKQAGKLSEKEIKKWENKGLTGEESGKIYNHGWTDPSLIKNGKIEFYTNYEQSDKNLNPIQVSKLNLDNYYKILYDISCDNNPNLDYTQQINQLNYLSLPHQRRKEELLKTQNDRLNSFLNKEQRKVFDLAISGKNVFFTGSAGTGKSFLLQRIINSLEIANKGNVAVTATTGIASVNIGGITIHSFSGIGIDGDYSLPENIVQKIIKQKSKKWLSNWKSTNTLIIDEISMLSGEIFDKLEYIARKIRGNNQPFGGLQVILTGDFFQLPPVKSKKLCFEAEQWEKVLHHKINLVQIYRQKESELVNLLNEIRFGEISDKSREFLKNLEREPSFPNDGIKPTLLVSTNNKKETINNEELNKIKKRSYNFRAIDWEDERYKGRLEILIKGCLATENLELKRGCQVMLIRNLMNSSGKLILVNGSQGIITDFRNSSDKKGSFRNFPFVRFENGIEMLIKEEEWTDETLLYKLVRARRTQIPLVLSWAITIHKSQGQSIERLKIDLSQVFERGQTYVALSRACSIKYLQVIGFSEEKIVCDKRVKKFYQDLSIL